VLLATSSLRLLLSMLFVSSPMGLIAGQGDISGPVEAASRLVTKCSTQRDHHERCQAFPTLPHVDPMLDHPRSCRRSCATPAE
jgi:hypothetical protein